MVLQHRTFTGPSSSQVKVFENFVDLALENQALPRLADVLFRKAGRIIPSRGFADLYMKKYRMDQKNYNFILSKIFDDFSICSNCQALESQ